MNLHSEASEDIGVATTTLLVFEYLRLYLRFFANEKAIVT
jgi:hypothetical protein